MTGRRPSRLPRWQEYSVYLSLGVLTVTGIAWLVLDQWVRIAGEFGAERHPAQHVTIILHGVAAYVFLVIAGAMIPVHVRLGWALRRNRSSGVTLALTCLLLALTALGLYYAGDELSRHWLGLVHWIVGFAVVPALLLHALRGRRNSWSLTPPQATPPLDQDRPTPAG